MTTIHLALDAIDSDFTLGATYGRIVGMAMSVAGLRAQGFSQNPYAGNRLSTIEHDAAGFNSNCEPGWYRTPNGVQIARPLTAAGAEIVRMSDMADMLHNQLITWDADVAFYGPGKPDWQRQFAHDTLASCHGHNYLVLTDTNISVASRITYCETLLAGASDGQGGRIATAIQYYLGFTVPRVFRTAYPERGGTNNPPSGTTIYYAWSDPATPGTALDLDHLHAIERAIPAGTVLGQGATWHLGLTA